MANARGVVSLRIVTIVLAACIFDLSEPWRKPKPCSSANGKLQAFSQHTIA